MSNILQKCAKLADEQNKKIFKLLQEERGKSIKKCKLK